MRSFRVVSSRRGRFVIVSVAASVLLIGGAAVVVASSANHDRQPTPSIKPLITGQASGGGCRFGYDTQSSTNIPPDDSTADNAPAASVSIKKTCAGAVVGHFTSEVSTPAAGDFIHIDMRATCTATGGLSSPCTVGQQVFASPGHSFFQNAQSAIGTHAVDMVWTGLKKGVWKFDVLPGGNGNANLQFRTFTVEAFNGG
jgi:hypothetical protein